MTNSSSGNSIRIAVTGGIAMGKSTVVAIAEELGLSAVSADAIAREVFDDAGIQQEVAKFSGLDVPIDRDRLRKLITTDSKLRAALNALTHPIILERLRNSNADIFEIPLLIEACLQQEFDLVWVVACPPEVQIERLLARTGDRDETRRLIAAQLPIEVKEVFADEVVRTNRPVSSVRDDIKRLLRVA